MPQSATNAAARDAALSAHLQDADAVDKIIAFETMLKRWNRHCNLVSRGDVRRLRERHVLDSLALLPWWQGTLADVGSGGGFPGLPLAIARPRRDVLLIERSQRKCLFLRQAVIELALPNVEVAMADAARYQPRALFGTVVARAVAPPARAWRVLRRLVAPDGAVLFQSREALAEAQFDGGTIHHAERSGVGWVTVVGVASESDGRESACRAG